MSAMPHEVLIEEIESWLIDEALGDPDIVELFDALCIRLHAAGVPLERAAMSWPTLHPLFQAEQIYWRRGEDAKLSQMRHDAGTPEAFEKSPFAHVLRNSLTRLRRRLTGPERLIDFPVLEELEAQGFTDYLMTATSFQIAEVRNYRGGKSGILASWSTRRDGGYTTADLKALTRIQRVFAVACHSSIQKRVMANLVNAYLGQTAGWRVLSGDIRRGDGERIQAVVWYSDLRDSTRLSNAMAPEAYLDLLRCYYDCTAQAVIEEGGEILEFIGDAVLAIFPIKGETGRPEAVRAATRAMERALDAKAEKAPQISTLHGVDGIRFSISMAVGEVMFGNIGVPERLTFSAIGPVVNAVARIDDLTKDVGRSVLATEDVAKIEPERWKTVGRHALSGFDEPIELFARVCTRDAFTVGEKADRISA